jgi:two-component sensor histidine kinase
MTEYLIAARAVIVLWTTLAVMPVEFVLTQLKPNWSAAASSHKRRSRAPADPEQGRELGVVTILPAQDRDERTLLRELTHRIHNEFISSINVVSAAAVRTENPEVKVALSNVVELLEQHADINRVLSVPDRDGLVDAAECIRRLAFAISRATLEPVGIRLALLADTLPLESERCWRLALAVHELVTNAARHACFNGRRDGAVKIKLADRRGGNAVGQTENSPELLCLAISVWVGLCLYLSLVDGEIPPSRVRRSSPLICDEDVRDESYLCAAKPSVNDVYSDA